MKTISIITACYNSEKFISDCLHSIDMQTYKAIEHIIVDGKSTDGTLDLLKSREGITNKLISEKDYGIYDAFNKGLRFASGEVVAFLNSDDLYSSRHIISEVMEVFNKNPQVGAVYGDLLYFNSNYQILRYWKSTIFKPWKLKLGWMPPHPTLFVKREWYNKTGVFDDSFSVSADYKKMLELFGSEGFNAHYMPKVLVNMRLGGASNGSLKSLIIASLEDWKILRQMGFGHLGGSIALLSKKITKLIQLLNSFYFKSYYVIKF